MQISGYLNRTWLHTALAYLFIVALLGLLMRFMAVETLPGLNFKYLLHAHSHTALLGWVYAVIYIAFLQIFLPVQIASGTKYKVLFWLTQFAVLGMLVTFPFQGYAAASITFSTLHIVCTYVFAYFFLKDLKRTDLYKTKVVSIGFIKAALFFLVISSFGPFSLAPMMVNGLAGSKMYYLAVYYYLHFQYNGWITFAIFAILFRWWRRSGIQFSQEKGKLFFRLLFWSCIPAYALSALWAEPAAWVYMIGALAAAVQVAAFVYFAISFFKITRLHKTLVPKAAGILFTLAFTALGLKFAMQLISALPEIARVSYVIREFIIGYLHLVLIGFVSLYLLAYFISQKVWKVNNYLCKSGLVIFISAFIISELLIFLQGFLFWKFNYNLPSYALLLFAASIFLPAGIALFFAGQFKKSSPQLRN